MLVSLKYRWLKLRYFFLMNFGFDRYGFQFLSLHFVKRSREVNEYLLSQHYETYDLWCIGSYFIIIE
jgi:hypothetical protein